MPYSFINACIFINLLSQLDQESIISVRVADAVDKVKQRAEEDKQAVLMETRKQIREAVNNVRTEMETRITTTSTSAVQDAIKEAHKQSSSKEVSTHAYTHVDMTKYDQKCKFSILGK